MKKQISLIFESFFIS
jgi:hypothetical protein